MRPAGGAVGTSRRRSASALRVRVRPARRLRRLALAGPMGSGKTTVGRLVARRQGLRFVDLDARIGDIARIFARIGEAGFRARERVALRRLALGHGVLSLGGGTVVDPRNRARLRGWRIVVLTASASTLRARTGDGASRPLLDKLEQLLQERAAVYAAVGPTIHTDDLSSEAVADRVEVACGWR